MQKIDQSNVVPVATVDPFEAYADAVAPRFAIGPLIRFSKGDYLAGEQNENVPAGSEFIAALDELMIGYLRWEANKPAEHVLVRVADGDPAPKRSALGYDDASSWELDADGQPRDPWQAVNYLPLLAPDGGLFTFTTSSRGGMQTIANLARRYANHRKGHPDVFPRIILSVGSYQHSNPQFGRIKFPDFLPAGYAPKRDFYDALEAAGIVAPAGPKLIEEQIEATAVEEPPPVESEEEFADEIPF